MTESTARDRLEQIGREVDRLGDDARKGRRLIGLAGAMILAALFVTYGVALITVAAGLPVPALEVLTAAIGVTVSAGGVLLVASTVAEHRVGRRLAQLRREIDETEQR